MGNFIEDALDRKQNKSPQMAYMWRVQLPDISGEAGGRSFGEKIKDGYTEKLTGSGFWGGLKAAINLPMTTASVLASAILDSDVAPLVEINHRVTSFDLPFPSFDTRRVNTMGEGWKAATIKSVGTISMKMMEYEDGATLKYCTDWLKRVNRDDGCRNVPSFYKKPIKLVRLSTSGLDLHVSTCTGCFPLEVGTVSHSYDASGIIEYTITFAVDTIEHEIIPYDTILKRIENEQIGISNSPTNPFSSGFDISKHLWNIFTGI